MGIVDGRRLRIPLRHDFADDVAAGRQIEVLETLAPGSVEFLPNLPHQRRRRLDGERLSIHFSEGNQIQSFRGIQVATHTEPLPQEGQKAPPSLTWSDGLLQAFKKSIRIMAKDPNPQME